MRRPRHEKAGEPVDLTVRVGSLTLPNPIMSASGTAGHGAELSRYFDLSSLGAIVVKSLSPLPWAGNPPPRVHETAAGMINSVGLQGPGVEAWLEHELPALERTGARVVASIWGRTVNEFERASALLADAPPSVVAVEVNVSCPNLEDRSKMFAHSASATFDVIAASGACRRPRWAKLSPNTYELVDIAGAARAAGAEAVTLVNTVLGMVIDIDERRPLLGAARGGLSGRAIHPVAVRSVFDCREAHRDLPIVGVGGVASAGDAIELIMAGANAVQIGTATFADPRAMVRILDGVREWCRQHGVNTLDEIRDVAHAHAQPQDQAIRSGANHG
ncbi:MAG TPA: dihydroorotate dehydrogenase [Acidimicrobiales bacterium]|nr:dihydroorotate dehydrogenase [Acidimicrobiales bacterium]